MQILLVIFEQKGLQLKAHTYISYREYIAHTPSDHTPKRGRWIGSRGNGIFVPATNAKNKELNYILRQHGLIGIQYMHGVPVGFFDLSLQQIKIQDGISSARERLHPQCDRICAVIWSAVCVEGDNCWTGSKVRQWRQDNHYTWHEWPDMITVDLIPTQINAFFGHVGGIAEAKARDQALINQTTILK